MFKIIPIQSTEEQIKTAAACGAEYREGFFGYSMQDAESGEIMGFSQFEISGECGYLSDLRGATGTDDFEAMFILGRSTMNFIDLCGTHSVRATAETGDDRLLRAIGFKPTEDGYFCDMTGFFDGHCDGKK